MGLLEGIQLHELILMVLGFILGLVLIFVFLMSAMKGKTNLKLLVGFIAPIVMIGYPSIQSIQFSKELVKIDKLVAAVNNNPTDTAAQRLLIDQIQLLPAERFEESSEAMTTLANAQAALGMYDDAKASVDKAAAINGGSTKVQESQKDIHSKWELQKAIEIKVKNLDEQVKKLQKQPTNKPLRDSIAVALETLNVPIHLDNQKLISVAKAFDALGKVSTAEAITDGVLKVNAQETEAKDFKASLDRKKTGLLRPNNAPINLSKNRTTRTPAKTTVAAPVAPKVDSAASRLLLIPKAVSNDVKLLDKN